MIPMMTRARTLSEFHYNRVFIDADVGVGRALREAGWIS
jgi:hypothetical protein